MPLNVHEWLCQLSGMNKSQHILIYCLAYSIHMYIAWLSLKLLQNKSRFVEFFLQNVPVNLHFFNDCLLRADPTSVRPHIGHNKHVGTIIIIQCKTNEIVEWIMHSIHLHAISLSLEHFSGFHENWVATTNQMKFFQSKSKAWHSKWNSMLLYGVHV